jgi:arsenite methyltransferase
MSEAQPTRSPTQETLERYIGFLKRTRDMGFAGHRGGLQATRELLEMCELQPGQQVLEAGCGSGYTACTLAKEYEASVVAVDAAANLLARTQERARSMKVEGEVALALADARRLPFADASFDGVVCESVLAFMEPAQKAETVAEFYRVLRPRGFLAVNEMTFLDTPPPEFAEAIRGASRSQPGYLAVPVDPEEHRRLLEDAGFSAIQVETGDVPLKQQTFEQLQVDGFRALKPLFASIFDKEMRDSVYKKEMGEAQRTFEAHTGYGLYFGRK